MKKIFIACLLSVTVIFVAAQEKRALIIAIDKYTPPADYKPGSTAGRLDFRDLDGCINDAKGMESIIISRFQFKPEKVDTLFNENATRDGILKQMNALLDKSNPGDIAFIYYAGHGSQVTNSLSSEKDKKDETMVPCDTWKEGVSDVRDKELAKIFDKFVDKNVKLTVIMDCCHSGSISRGPNEPGKFRFIAEENYDAKDPSTPIAPETRKEGSFLIMSAAQDNEYAQEQRDENDMPHGAFTVAFMQALEQQTVNASVQNLFTAIRAILKSNGKKQEPVLGGSPERQQQTLFGLAKGTIPDRSLVAIAGFEKNKVILQGGFALGLYKENELVKFKLKDTLVKLHVDTVLGVNRAIASIVKGTITGLKAGDLLEVTNWVSSGAPLIKLYIPSANMSYDDIMKLAAINVELKKSKKIKWINNLEKADPYLTVFYSGNKCYINIDGAGKKEQNEVSAAAILSLCKQDSSLYFELPPSKELAGVVQQRLKSNRSIRIVTNANDANYILYGTIDESGKPSYGLRRAQTSSRDSLESMPVQTRNFSLANNSGHSFDLIADSVYEYAMRLSKLRGWLQMSGPQTSQNSFPYHLEIVNDDVKKVISNGAYKIGDNISVHLALNENANSYTGGKKYIYVFAIDKSGSMALYYPDDKDGNVANQYPKYEEGGKMMKDFTLLETYTVPEPSGTDNFFLLASDEPIPNYALVFNQQGVNDGVVKRGVENKSPLSDLLDIGNAGSRGMPTKLPVTWSLKRISFRCTY